ncbi:MAG: AbrB/MazE/SpoVT family DNA-binding domain-containing protein [Gemmatimonadetes bacterium]|nr:AbrB/MazE/SpoVT family DNA-binding domain-containing protein [Gemmatimonadota bacterium]
MRAAIQKWGNSLAIRIPKALAQDTRLGQGIEVEITIEDGRLVLEPVRTPRPTLKRLLAGITKGNRHGEVEWGDATGREAW